MELSEAQGVIDYAIKWPLSAPVDAFRTGSEYNLLVGLVSAVFAGIPGIVWRVIIGPAKATWNYAKSIRD